MAEFIGQSGNINIDVNNDGDYEFTFQGNHFGAGTNNPSSELHLNSGNLLIQTGNLNIGQPSSSSALNIDGHYGFGIQTVSDNTQLSGNSLVFVDTSAGSNITLSLPNASEVSGREYTIKRLDNNAQVVLTGEVIDNSIDLTLNSSSDIYSFVQLRSDGSQYRIMGGNGYSLTSADNLIAWYTFDEPSGNTIYDRMGNVSAGNLNGGFSFSTNSVEGKFGRALSFDGVDDYIDLGNADPLFMEKAVTVSIWVKVFTHGASFFEKANDSAFTHYTLTDNGFGGDPRPRWIVNVNFTTYAAQGNSVNEIDTVNWHHIVGRFDGASTQSDLWINGVQQTDIENTNPDDTLSGSVTTRRRTFIGANSYSGGLDAFMSGYFDDLRIYNKVLSTQEIQSLYELGR